MRVSEITEENITEKIIDSLLYKGIEDTGESGDCIMVLGSMKASEYRMPVAAKAYFNKRAYKILLCGGSVRDFREGAMTEARHMMNKALEMGVLKEDLILDENSQTTIENILCALLELERSIGLNNIKRIILVTTTFHMRRSLELARKYFPSQIQIIPCPANDRTTTKDNWRDTEQGYIRAKTEALNIVWCVKNGYIDDFEI